MRSLIFAKISDNFSININAEVSELVELVSVHKFSNGTEKDRFFILSINRKLTRRKHTFSEDVSFSKIIHQMLQNDDRYYSPTVMTTQTIEKDHFGIARDKNKSFEINTSDSRI